MLLVVMLAFLPIVLDLTILHVAIPSLTLALEATGTEVLWIIDIYPLLMASLLIPMGTLADRIGHRRLLFIGLSVFGVGSALAAMSPTAQALIGARALMAVGAAMVMPCTLAIIRQTFKDDTERATALGIWAAVASAGAALGPLAGGALLEHFWWGSVFLVNVPVLALAIPLVFFLAPRHAVLAEGAWKPAQALLLMAGLMATVYAIKTGLKSDGAWWLNLVIGCIGTAMLAWFVRIQLRSTHAMLDMSLFSKPAIRMGVVMALVVMGSLAGVELLLAQELQFVTGRSPLEAGLFMLPLMVASAVGGPLAGLILRAVGLRLVATGSLALAAISIAGLAYSDFNNAGFGVAVLMVGLGLALGVGLTASSVAIMSSAPEEKAGSAGSLEATSHDLGTGLGIAGFGLVMASSYQRAIHLPEGIAPEVATIAARSIGETMLAAQSVGGPSGQAIAEAGRQAFSTSHSMVLISAAVLIGFLSIMIFSVFRQQANEHVGADTH
ncbi:MFS transporter [Pseudomonas aeruginosa]